MFLMTGGALGRSKPIGGQGLLAGLGSALMTAGLANDAMAVANGLTDAAEAAERIVGRRQCRVVRRCRGPLCDVYNRGSCSPSPREAQWPCTD
jgi:hypothetical protein